ncbi:MAG: ABC transporter substrate-binding protein [Chloroflexota bacterium]
MVGRTKWARTAIGITVLALTAAACGGGSTASPGTSAQATGTPVTSEPPSTEPVVVCELAYYTGSFAAYGPSLTEDVAFPINEVINDDPPLGRSWTLVSEDIGDDHEGQAAKTCLEQRGAEIVVSIAHQYRTYREYMMEYWKDNDSPLGPSVHGGAIPGNLGGKAAEPIFRAQGLDEALGMSGILYAETINAKKIVIFATQVEGFQLAANAAEKAAEAVGMEVLARIDVQAEQASFGAEAQRIATLAPDAVIVQAGSVESAALIKAAAEAGLSLNWIGETGWIQTEFIGTLGTAPIATQKGIGFAAFSYNDTTPAWDFFSAAWSAADHTAPEDADPKGLYHFSTYDLLVQTALAVEAGGSYKASDWAPAMHEVGEAPGEICYTYADCLALIRDGKDIDYEGITGTGTYTDGGVNDVVQSYTPFGADGKAGTPVILDAERALEIIELIKTEAECDPADPPNECTW